MHVVRAYERMHQRMLRQANDNDSRFVDDPAMVMAVMASQGQDLFSMTIKAENDVTFTTFCINPMELAAIASRARMSGGSMTVARNTVRIGPLRFELDAEASYKERRVFHAALEHGFAFSHQLHWAYNFLITQYVCFANNLREDDSLPAADNMHMQRAAAEALRNANALLAEEEAEKKEKEKEKEKKKGKKKKGKGGRGGAGPSQEPEDEAALVAAEEAELAAALKESARLVEKRGAPDEQALSSLPAERPLSVEEEEPPADFICPITTEVMRNPVMAADGHAYERSAIERWLATKSTSPMTGEELQHTCLANHHMLRRMIREWGETHSAR